MKIAIASSRSAKTWKNGDVTWAEFVRRVSVANQTGETYKEYLSFSKDKRANIKDVGGFVGGYLKDGRRNIANVVSRSMITLDVDVAKDFSAWEDYKLFGLSCAVMYTTHKHCPESPRYRIVIPLSRDVTPDEYGAVARKTAAEMGINNFDRTTFDATRLMYWPSCSRDGEFRYEVLDGEPLDADKVLSSYTDWHDVSTWPVADDETAVLKKGASKQGCPVEKPGLVGTFCREYDIPSAIEKFLPSVYTEAGKGRYTYVGGSTSGGLVLYGTDFAFSHHATDPASGVLCNAFDLVRLHLYKDMDEDIGEDTPINRRPSYKAMTDFIVEDSAIRKRVAEERLENAREDFADKYEADVPKKEENADWLTKLDIDKNGSIRSTTANIRLILDKDSLLSGAFAYNSFNGRSVLLRAVPWRRPKHGDSALCDADESGLRDYLETCYGITGQLKISDALVLTCRKASFHPVKDYLSSLVWDGEKRVDSLLIDYLGADDTPYTRAVTRKALTAAVARVFSPGCKFDNVLTLVGGQGIGKSTIISRLGGEWFSDTFSTVNGKEAFEQIQGFWLIEMAELAGLRKAEVESIKQFISKREDSYRAAYARNVEIRPRQCVFFGSTNEEDFLRDPTGNRRFWPVKVTGKGVKDVFNDLSDERDQIWAEAVALYKDKETLYLDGELEREANAIRDEHIDSDPRAGLVQEYLNTLLPPGWYQRTIEERRRWFASEPAMREAGTEPRWRVCIAEIWCECFNLPLERLTRKDSFDIAAIMAGMREAGWTRKEKAARCNGYGVTKMYRKSGTIDAVNES